MSVWDILAQGAPFFIGLLVMGGAVAGSFLKPAQRRFLERWLLAPAGLVLLIVGAVIGVQRHEWWMLVLVAIGAIAGFRIARKLYFGAGAPTGRT